jgi:hypothetical protein
VALAPQVHGTDHVRVVQAKTADDVISCGPGPATSGSGAALPFGGRGGGEVLGENVSAPLPVGGEGGGEQIAPPFVQHVLTANASIASTGPNSNNVITSNQSVNTAITNTNNISLTNSNSQSATSGNASVSGNTTGGSATSGDADNSNATDLSVLVDN